MITPEESTQIASMMNYMERKDLFPNFAACTLSTANVDGVEGYCIEFAQYVNGGPDLNVVAGGGKTLTEAMITISSKIKSI